MKVAVTYNSGEVFLHFGRTPAFKVYEISDGKSPDNKRIEELLSQMTLREKVSQMFTIRSEVLTGVDSRKRKDRREAYR